MEALHSFLDSVPFVSELSLPLQLLVLASGLTLASVTLNVLAQLCLPASPSSPPLVFHWFPILGSAVSYGTDPYKFFETNRAKHGDVFTFVLLGRKMTVALGAKGSNLVFNGKLSQVSAEAAYHHLVTPVFGKEVVYDVPNAVFMEQKRMVKSGVSNENLRVYLGLIVDEVQQFLSHDARFEAFQSRKPGKSGAVPIFVAMSELIILTASRTLQGPEVRQGLDKSFADLYHDLDAGFTPINFVFPYLPLPANLRRDRAQKQMSDFYRSIVEKRRTHPRDDMDPDMISALMGQKYKNGRSLSDLEIAHIMIAILMAGQHTSSATSSWALLRLGSKPELIEELYQEQVKAYGDGQGGFMPQDFDTQRSSVPLLDAVVRETLRLHPPIHSIMRKVMSPITVPATMSSSASSSRKGDRETLVIPEGHYVMAAPGVSQRDPKIWAQHDDFDPHRWLSEKGPTLQAEAGDGDDTVDYGWGAVSSGSNSAYLPFGAGRHRCIGESFAYIQLGAILAEFVRRFDWRLPGGRVPEPDYNSMIVLPAPPAHVIFTERAERIP